MVHEYDGCEDCKRREAEEYLAQVIRESVNAEREACARLLQSYGRWLTPSEGAALIRSRKS